MLGGGGDQVRNPEAAPPPEPPLACPVCHDTVDCSRVGMRLFPCAHAACGACAALLTTEEGERCVACPVCRARCAPGDVARHRALERLSAAHHCPRCSERWDAGPHKPMVLRPCLHQVCAACANESECAVCSAAVEGRAEDDAYCRALTTGRLALPPRAEEEEEGTLDGAMLAFCLWLQAHPVIHDMAWLYSAARPRESWPEEKKRLYNRCAELALAVGRRLPRDNHITSHTVALALGLPKGLESAVELEMTYACQRLRARQQFAPRVRRELERLPLRPHHRLSLEEGDAL